MRCLFRGAATTRHAELSPSYCMRIVGEEKHTLGFHRLRENTKPKKPIAGGIKPTPFGIIPWGVLSVFTTGTWYKTLPMPTPKWSAACMVAHLCGAGKPRGIIFPHRTRKTVCQRRWLKLHHMSMKKPTLQNYRFPNTSLRPSSLPIPTSRRHRKRLHFGVIWEGRDG